MTTQGQFAKMTKTMFTATAVATLSFASAQAPVSDGPSGNPDRKNESPIAQTMGIRQRLGEAVPKDLTFLDEDGKTIQFGDLLQGRPLVVVPIFYRCQTACSIITDNIMKTVAKANSKDELVVGRDFDVVMVSIHPKETPDLARAKKQLILNALTPPKETPDWRPRMEKSWRMLTGTEENVRKLVTDTFGVRYKYDAQKDLINHPTCTVMVTPNGGISSYTIGNGFPTRVVQTSLVYAEKNQVGQMADQSMMFGCIMLDPETGKYRPVVMNIVRLAGVLTILVLFGSIALMSLKSKRDNPFGGGETPDR